MRRPLFYGFLVLYLTVVRACTGQSLGQIQWQQSFGGTGQDSLRSLGENPDGGYILAGFSNSSTNGNKTSPSLGGYDYWLIRVDASGNKLWEHSFGGTNHDRAYAVAPTSDGSFILGGESFSGTNGCKTSPNFGASDYWVLLLDGSGNKLWEASFGGSSNEVLSTAKQTSDGGFILGGWSFSGADGNKTDTNFGGADIWLVRLDGAGNKLWDRSYGGAADETDLTIEVTSDDGFIFGATSRSGATGNKTNLSSGGWVVRLDSGGNKLWERIMVSHRTQPVVATVKPISNGEFLVGSSESYDCCGGVPCTCSMLYLARLDPEGNQVWLRALQGPIDGGGNPPTLVAVRQTGEGGFVTGFRIGDSSVWSRYYIYRLDSLGGLIWEQEFGSYGGFQSLFSLEAGRDGGFIFGGHSGQPPTGNKTSPNFGSVDFWVVKLLPEQAHLQLLPLANETEKVHFLLQTSYLGTYAIDRSPDLAGWEPWQTNLFTGATPEIIDHDTNQASKQFYRTRRLP